MRRILSAFQTLIAVCGVSCVLVDLESAPAVRYVGPMFVGVTIDSEIIQAKWGTLDLKSQKVLTLAKGLAPTYLRVGGTACDFLIFNMTQDSALDKFPSFNNYSMTVGDWDLLNNFVMNANWDLIFDVNVFLRQNGKWDPTNAIELLKYTVERGYKPIGYELGNEPNLFPEKYAISEQQLAEDFASFKTVLASAGAAPFLTIGPDTSGMTRDYTSNFLEAGGGKTVDVVTVHHYYTNGKTAKVDQFVNKHLLDSFIPMVDGAVETCAQKAPEKQCWLGETSSCYGGGAQNISDRYAAGFLWLDKLGLSALHGLQSVLRQSFYGANYGLINKELNPNPDYFLTVLFKRLVGGTVFNVTQHDSRVRVYAHCTNKTSGIGYKPGSVTVYMLNIASEPLTVEIPYSDGKTQERYILSPGDDDGLISQFVKLNGVVLTLPNDHELPPFQPEYSQGPIPLGAYNMGYIVIPDAMKQECM